MSKLIVRHPVTGNERPMTQTSFDLSGKKKGYIIIGKTEEPKSEVQAIMEARRAEKAAREAEKQNEPEKVTNEQPEKKKPGRPAKTQITEQ